MAANGPARERHGERRRTGRGAGFGEAPPYVGAVERRPLRPPVPVVLGPGAVELAAPLFGARDVGPLDADLTRQHLGEPIGERITVSGRVLDGRGRPVRGQLVELWQANAAGRYAHRLDDRRAPLDPHFTGTGRCLTDDSGRYRFTTIRPGAYPWASHPHSWRPAHLHFSLFGTAFTQRLVTQMYFPNDPLLPYDAIRNALPDADARRRLVAVYDPDLNEPELSLGYHWDIVLAGPAATWTAPAAPAREGR
ncbi:protocatechuate 3,4-dioxygenase subunit beta [Streptomyces triculaminicus]|uniref:protocatechuate 3,4-dioxygenase subunit beta n=1 Tax=Streptomyces triculaminicus TaxID=2816232 RepID=UPI0033D5967C